MFIFIKNQGQLPLWTLHSSVPGKWGQWSSVIPHIKTLLKGHVRKSARFRAMKKKGKYIFLTYKATGCH